MIYTTTDTTYTFRNTQAWASSNTIFADNAIGTSSTIQYTFPYLNCKVLGRIYTVEDLVKPRIARCDRITIQMVLRNYPELMVNILALWTNPVQSHWGILTMENVEDELIPILQWAFEKVLREVV